jgi:hypothetical protein
MKTRSNSATQGPIFAYDFVMTSGQKFCEELPLVTAVFIVHAQPGEPLNCLTISPANPSRESIQLANPGIKDYSCG